MDLINNTDFRTLKLVHFVSDLEIIEQLAHWEFMDDHWIGKSIGFTEWLRLEQDLQNSYLNLRNQEEKYPQGSYFRSGLAVAILKSRIPMNYSLIAPGR